MDSCNDPLRTRAGRWNVQSAGSSATLTHTPAEAASSETRLFTSRSSVAANTREKAAASPG
jgi:hypothetical protein